MHRCPEGATVAASTLINDLSLQGNKLPCMLMQFQSDVLDTITVRPKIVETTAMGAAYLAGLAVGYWESPEEIQKIWDADVHFKPTKERTEIKKGIEGWYRAIDALQYWANSNVKN